MYFLSLHFSMATSYLTFSTLAAGAGCLGQIRTWRSLKFCGCSDLVNSLIGSEIGALNVARPLTGQRLCSTCPNVGIDSAALHTPEGLVYSQGRKSGQKLCRVNGLPQV